MTDDQTQEYNRGESVVELLDNNATVWSGIPVIATRKGTIEDIQDDITLLANKQNQSTKSISDTKRQRRETMAERGAGIAQGIVSWLEDTEQTELISEYDFKKYQLKAQTAVNAKNRNEKVFAKADAERANLLPYGFTDTIIDAYGNMITAFVEIMGAADAKIAEKSSATAGLEVRVDDLHEEIEKLRTNVGIFRITNIGFYKAFLDAFKIDNTGVRHVKLRGTVKDAATGTVLPKALLKLIPAAGEAKTAKSGTTGKFRYFSLATGVYTLECTLPGYQLKSIADVAINPDGITEVLVEMVRG